MLKKAPGRPMQARPKILAAALDLFLEHGLDVSLDTIAIKAGTTRQTLYNHFASKTALLLEVFEHIKADLPKPLFTAQVDTLSLDELLPQVGRSVQHHFYNERFLRFERLLMVAMLQMPDMLPALHQRRTGIGRKLLAEVLTREHALGSIHVEHPVDAAKAFLGAALGPMYPAVLLGDALPSAQELDRLNQEACRTFLYAWKFNKG